MAVSYSISMVEIILEIQDNDFFIKKEQFIFLNYYFYAPHPHPHQNHATSSPTLDVRVGVKIKKYPILWIGPREKNTDSTIL